LPKGFIDSTTTIIYGNNIAIIIWREQPQSILIKSEELAKSYKNYFEFLWELSGNKPH
jgi:hypothetical protein